MLLFKSFHSTSLRGESVNEAVGACVPVFRLLLLRNRLFIYKRNEGRQRMLAITSRLSKFKA